MNISLSVLNHGVKSLAMGWLMGLTLNLWRVKARRLRSEIRFPGT
ncbi:hypothetical protein [Nitrosomonas ureae]|nr:hypothetical protein [Nitrosomonas ureae]